LFYKELGWHLQTKKNSLARWRILFGVFIFVLVLLAGMSVMLLYRLSFLPLALVQYCGQSVIDEYCMANVSQQLLYDKHWLSLQFIVYLLLSFILFPVFKNSLGLPLVNLFIVAVVSTVLIYFLTENRGIELYASFLSPLFVGLIIQAIRNRRVVINKI
jgi:hypothetical protein